MSYQTPDVLSGWCAALRRECSRAGGSVAAPAAAFVPPVACLFQWSWREDNGKMNPYDYDQNEEIEREFGAWVTHGRPNDSTTGGNGITVVGDRGTQRNGVIHRDGAAQHQDWIRPQGHATGPRCTRGGNPGL
jgi:hypothetical protein